VARKQPPAAPVAADPRKNRNRYRRRGRQPLVQFGFSCQARAPGFFGA
jgi:hypothetical protein